MNKILLDNKIYNVICKWTKKNEHDHYKKKFPKPQNVKKWNSTFSNLDFFITNLTELEKKMIEDKKYNIIEQESCLLCDDINIGNKEFLYDSYIWFDNIKHYVLKHNIPPPEKFIDFVYSKLNELSNGKKIKKILRLNGKIKNKDNKKFVKLKENQILILDALMEHGGYSKKYMSKNNIKYSEHAGVLDFHRDGLNKIIVSGNTTRVDREDEEIFLPKDLSDIKNYEYLFHTHPPTPKIGGRAKYGILYELPSIGDIFHFVDNYNSGSVIGSLVMTSEGLYNIRCLENVKKIKLSESDENILYKNFNDILSIGQDIAIKKYGITFSKNTFYKVISQDTELINNVNDVLKQYNLCIDFFPRKKNKYGKWTVSDIYLYI